MENATYEARPVRNRRGRGKLFVIIPILLIVALILMSSVTMIPTGHTGVVTTFGSVEDYTYDSGVHLKLPWQKVVMMDNRIQKQTVDLSCFWIRLSIITTFCQGSLRCTPES